MSEPKKSLKQCIEGVLPKIADIEATVLDFSGDQELLESQLNQFVADLAKLQAQRDAVNVEVPVELLTYVDEGGNPDVFTSDVFKRGLLSNQLSKGKVESFRVFREALLQEAESAFPAETQLYKAVTAADPPRPNQSENPPPEPQ